MLSIHLSNSKWLPRHDLKNLGRYHAEIMSTGYLPLVSITTTVEPAQRIVKLRSC